MYLFKNINVVIFLLSTVNLVTLFFKLATLRVLKY